MMDDSKTQAEPSMIDVSPISASNPDNNLIRGNAKEFPFVCLMLDTGAYGPEIGYLIKCATFEHLVKNGFGDEIIKECEFLLNKLREDVAEIRTKM